MHSPSRFRLGCDIGGTFTDFVLLDECSGRFRVDKVLTTPADPSAAVDTGLADLDADEPGFLARTGQVVHGTTLVINAVIERKGAKTALVTTAGFRDVLAMRREIRYDIYDIAAVYPEPLVARPWRRELSERIDAGGQVLRPLDEAGAAALIDELAAQGVQSVAVCLLHAYANPAHERAFAELAVRAQPGLSVCLSSEVLPEVKEYERTATTVVNAYVRPLMDRYLARLEQRLAARGAACGLSLMLSGGGITAPATARRFPVRLIESGPVGGGLAMAWLCARAGIADAVMFDMGGTTAKSCVVRDGHLLIADEYEVDRVHRFKRGSGTPVNVPTVDIIEIGAGGGSIARVDRMGLLRVGPDSASADPGPICYRRGGDAVTVTDADLVLGYLDPDFFLGGAMALDADAAARGIDEQIAAPLGLTRLEAAFGVHEVVTENMAAAIRMYLSEKGLDARELAVVAIGGAGPVHAERFAARLGASRVLVPRAAGVFSALGFMVAPVAYEVSRTRILAEDAIDRTGLEADFQALETQAREVIEHTPGRGPIGYRRDADVCYRGQGARLRVNLDGAPDAAAIKRRFLHDYRARYGNAYADQPIQLVTLRVTATRDQPPPAVSLDFAATGDAAAARKGEREAFDPITRALRTHSVYATERLPGGAVIAGPAIFEEDSSTFIMSAHASATVDPRGWLDIEIKGEGEGEGER
jgi:N-methylhydantoinase A